MDLDTILKQWQTDCEIPKMHLDDASRNTPILHAKYMELLAKAKLTSKRLEFEQKTLLKQKWLYYNGKMDEETLKELGWNPDPFDGLRVLKGEMDYYYDADPEIQKSEEKIQYYKTIIDTLVNIIDTIKWRHQTIRNIIDWKRFESGS